MRNTITFYEIAVSFKGS